MFDAVCKRLGEKGLMELVGADERGN
jgi:hypothetical protein